MSNYEEQLAKAESETTPVLTLEKHIEILEQALVHANLEQSRLLQALTAEAAKVYRLSTFIDLAQKKWSGVPELQPTFWNLARVAKTPPHESLLEVKAETASHAYRHCLNMWCHPSINPSQFTELCEHYSSRVRTGEIK
jgi:hypothetical protein